MFSFKGFLREEDDDPMTVINCSTGDPGCLGSSAYPPLPETTGDRSTSPPRRTNFPHHGSRRIDMASRINETITVIDRDHDTEIQDAEIQDDPPHDDDLKEKNDSEPRVAVCGILCCTPWGCRIVWLASFLLAFLLLGLGIGFRMRESGETSRQFSAAMGQEMDAGQSVESPTGTAAQAPTAAGATTSDIVPSLSPSREDSPIEGSRPSTSAPEESSSPSSQPTEFFDLNLDEYLDEITDDTIEEITDDSVNQEFVEWDNSASPYLVGAYYYPWHGNNFHNGDGYLRRDLIPQQQPTLGEYDDSMPETIAQHLQWSQQANIGLWITSWWGPNGLEDTTTKDVIMTHENLGDLKISLHYETSNRVREGLAAIDDDMQHMCDNYFNHPNYYKINGRPVVFVYVTRKLEEDGDLEPTILTMRTASSKCGYNVYIIGDHAFNTAPDESEVFVPFWYFDAVTNYDLYGSMGQPSPYAGRSLVDQYYSDQEQWRARALEKGCRYVPAVSPGYNDRGVRFAKNHPPLSRRLSETLPEGSLFVYQLSKAKALVDASVDNLLVVNSFNEWHEDTQIEPARGVTTKAPFNLTHGVYYEGYGELYLNLLRQWTIT